MPSFPHFALLPGELQDMVWDEAANAPMVHFMVPVVSQSDWFDGEAALVPDKQSGARGLVHLSLTCRDARAAVVRRNKLIINKTVFRTFPFQGYKRIDLVLDLNVDLVCLANPTEWMEWEHVILWSARRLAIRYDPKWDVLNGVLAQEASLVDIGGGGCVHTALPGTRRDSEQQPSTGEASSSGLFCIRCITNGLQRFRNLEEFCLIVESRDQDRILSSWKESNDPVPRFYAYNGACFEIGHNIAHAMSGIEPAIALESIRECLVSAHLSRKNRLFYLRETCFSCRPAIGSGQSGRHD
ncbi:hypothetical protein V8F06_002708 [Rhypophila decipiens]